MILYLLIFISSFEISFVEGNGFDQSSFRTRRKFNFNLTCTHWIFHFLKNILGFWIGAKDVHEEYFPNFGPGSIDGPGLLPGDNDLLPDRPGNGYLGGQWKWTNGKPWNYINWDNGQPLNQGSDDCVMIRSKDGLWEDFACTSRLKVPF